MTDQADNLDELLGRVAAGELDALTPKEVDRLERVLNTHPDAAARLADVPVGPDAALREALDAAAVRPEPEDWSRVWEHVAAEPVGTGGGRHRRTWRLWTPLTAAAACVLMVGLWRASVPPVADRNWPLQLATDAHIEELEVFDNDTAFVVSAGGTDGTDIIWVLEDEG